MVQVFWEKLYIYNVGIVTGGSEHNDYYNNNITLYLYIYYIKPGPSWTI